MVREGARPTTQGNRVNATEAGLSPCVITGRASTRVRVGPVTRDFAWNGAKSRGWRGLALTRVLARPAMTQGESIHPIALKLDVPVKNGLPDGRSLPLSTTYAVGSGGG
jgi:hypothetical protein